MSTLNNNTNTNTNRNPKRDRPKSPARLKYSDLTKDRQSELFANIVNEGSTSSDEKKASCIEKFRVLSEAKKQRALPDYLTAFVVAKDKVPSNMTGDEFAAILDSPSQIFFSNNSKK